MSAALWSRSLRASTSYRPLYAPSTPLRRCLHASAPVLARKKKLAKAANPEAMTIPDAVFLLKSVEVARPNNAIELHVKAQFKRGEAALRGRMTMPRDPRTTEAVLLVFCELEQVDKALAAGATWAGGEELVEDVMDGKIQPTAVLATPGMLAVISRLGRTLGPKGLMPNTKRGTVMADVVKGIEEAKGAFTWKGDKFGMVRAKVGRVHFPLEDIERNISAFLNNVKSGGGGKRASYDRGKTYDILKVHMSSTQGPGIELRDLRY